MRLLAILCLLIAAPASFAAAEPAQPSWNGVWQGTIGKAEVRVCLQHRDYDDRGAYYYLRHLSIISLGPAGKDIKPGATRVWSEAPDSDKVADGPLWTLSPANGAILNGAWTSGGKTLPIRLTRVAMKDPTQEACSDMAFNALRATPPKLSVKHAVVDGVAYDRLLVSPGPQFGDMSIESFQLIGSTPAIQRINAELGKSIPKTAAGSDYLDCSRANLAATGYDGDYQDTTSPKMITRNWMVSEDDTASTCGGAHPDSGSSWRVWNLRTGATVNPWDWLTPAAAVQTLNDPGTKDAYTTVVIGAVLRQRLIAGWSSSDEDCKDIGRDNETWDAHITRDGLAFTPELPHVIQACADDVVIPYAKLAPLLNPQGKAAIASILSDLKR